MSTNNFSVDQVVFVLIIFFITACGASNDDDGSILAANPSLKNHDIIFYYISDNRTGSAYKEFAFMNRAQAASLGVGLYSEPGKFNGKKIKELANSGKQVVLAGWSNGVTAGLAGSLQDCKTLSSLSGMLFFKGRIDSAKIRGRGCPPQTQMAGIYYYSPQDYLGWQSGEEREFKRVFDRKIRSKKKLLIKRGSGSHNQQIPVKELVPEMVNMLGSTTATAAGDCQCTRMAGYPWTVNCTKGHTEDQCEEIPIEKLQNRSQCRCTRANNPPYYTVSCELGFTEAGCRSRVPWE